jgi:hypothetical protein
MDVIAPVRPVVVDPQVKQMSLFLAHGGRKLSRVIWLVA